MKLGIMQPYIFPYLGYFDIINNVDKWIVFDTAQYIRHGWINRNRILHPKEGWQYIIVPLKKHQREIPIKDVQIANGPNWGGKIIGQLQHYKKKAPYFSETVELVENCLALEDSSISRLNAYILDKVCERLQIRFDYSFFSEMKMELGPVEGPQDWALRISEAIGADEYVNPSGGVNIFDEAKFDELGIKLTIRNLSTFEYASPSYEFVPGLSIIDVLMWNPPDKIKDYLDKHKI